MVNFFIFFFGYRVPMNNIVVINNKHDSLCRRYFFFNFRSFFWGGEGKEGRARGREREFHRQCLLFFFSPPTFTPAGREENEGVTIFFFYSISVRRVVKSPKLHITPMYVSASPSSSSSSSPESVALMK